MELAQRLLAVRHGVSFSDCLAQCAASQELIVQYDRIRGTNLQRRGTALDLSVDDACGRMDSEIKDFIEFCWEFVFFRFASNASLSPRGANASLD